TMSSNTVRAVRRSLPRAVARLDALEVAAAYAGGRRGAHDVAVVLGEDLGDVTAPELLEHHLARAAERELHAEDAHEHVALRGPGGRVARAVGSGALRGLRFGLEACEVAERELACHRVAELADVARPRIVLPAAELAEDAARDRRSVGAELVA